MAKKKTAGAKELCALVEAGPGDQPYKYCRDLALIVLDDLFDVVVRREALDKLIAGTLRIKVTQKLINAMPPDDVEETFWLASQRFTQTDVPKNLLSRTAQLLVRFYRIPLHD